ncbi:MAG: helix-turn-helix transcriptional regulator [Peptococcaceae bacterium]|nr:helix-turn-helix transcriptional regulator [Peptococcaceae bacterium]
MKKTYIEIIKKMVEMGIDRQYLAERLGKSITYVNARFDGSFSWTLDDMYQLAVLFQIPVEQIIDYFPPRPALRKAKDLDKNLIFITPLKKPEPVIESGVSWRYDA